MSTKVEKRIVVNEPVSRAYSQWTRFEEFPHFMSGVESVARLGDDRLKWVAHIAGVHRTWEARILEQVPDRKVAWASTEGATNSGTIEFRKLGENKTELALRLEYQPAGVVEKVGDLLHVVGRQAEHDLKKFKDYIEHMKKPAAEPTPYNRFAHPFDQTGGLVDFEGESDETAEGENYSATARRKRHNEEGTIPPYGGLFNP